MYILGINGGVRMGYQDISAVLMKDGEVIAAIEEERLNRVKNSPNQLPERAIVEVLSIGGITIQDIDIVATHGSTWGDQYQEVLTGYFKNTFGSVPTIQRYHHHDCHSASAFYAAGYAEALVISIDGSGDGVCTQISIGNADGLKLLHRFERPNSLGLFYSLITQYCGFKKDSDEYKLMGLSSYGDASAYNFDWLLGLHDEGQYTLDTSYLVEIKPGQPQPSKQEMFFNQKLIDKLGTNRRKGEALDERFKNIGASAQRHLEKAIINIVKHYIAQTGIRKVCLAGGVALNCVVNQKLMDLPEVEALFIQPASSDAGISLGAAMLASAAVGQKPVATDNVYWGRGYSNQEISRILDQLHAPYKRVAEPALVAAEAIHAGKVVGWVQGRDEFGPRALGNRSILADPTRADMQELVNLKIKFRESFRPFCPSVLEEDSTLYFEGAQAIAPYMTITYNVKPTAAKQLPAITHVDGTARIQTVNTRQNPLYYQLLQHLKRLNGHGVVLNTSFNRDSEPIVHSPVDAVSAFYGCGMDVLVIGDCVLRK